MPHRSTLVRCRSPLAALLCCAVAAALALSATAGAQDDIPVPASAPTVAGPTASGTTLIAFVRGEELCTALQERGARRPTGVDDGGGLCGPLPVLGPLGVSVMASSSSSGDASVAQVYGAVGTDVTAVELRAPGRTVGHAEAPISPLPGAAAELRFFLVESPTKPPPDELALLDATGAVRGAVGDEGSTSPLSTFRAAGERPAGPVLERGRRGGAAWTLRAATRHVVAPTPLEPERRVARPCVRFAAGGGARGIESAFDTCDQETFAAPAIVQQVGETCGPIGAYVTVLTRPAVRRVVVVLGDGRRRSVPLRALPGATAGTRAGVLVVGAGVALRRMLALGGGDRVLQTDELRRAPADGAPCSDDGSSSGVVLLFGPDAGRALGHAPHVLHAADDGARLCLAVDRAPRVPQDCQVPPLDPTTTALQRLLTADGRFLLGLVPPDVAAARLRLDDGSTRDVAAAPVPGYAGQYAAVTRVVAVDLPGAHRVVGYDLLDARGRVLANEPGPERRAPQHVTTLLRVPGLPALRGALLPGAGDVDALTCVALGPVSAIEPDCILANPGFFSVRVECSPRRLVVVGGLAHANERLTVRTTSGREIAGRTAPLPAAFGWPAGTSAALAVVPGDAAPRAIVVRRPRHATRSYALKLPAAARQCGYVAFAGP